MGMVVIYRKERKTIEKICATSEEYIGQTTYLRPSIPLKALNYFFSEHHKAQFTFLFVQLNKIFFEESTKVKKTFFRQFSAINPWKDIADSRNLHQNSPLYTLFKLDSNSIGKHHFEASGTR